jgi:pantoate--beta-alanine ligase
MTISGSPSQSPRVVSAAEELRTLLTEARRQGRSIGVVPTMGALHEGHLSLVDAARKDCDLVAVTIFVNPTQFGPGEDFTRYPRTLDADVSLLSSRGVDLVFAPTTESMYGPRHATRVIVAGPSLGLEGEFRPTHFEGVATIVLKLFNLVQPDRAYFGSKDFQQVLVVKRMVADLDLPVDIVVCPTVREADGLAMSSRNVYLSSAERERALALSRSLQHARQLVASGTREVPALLAAMREILRAAEAQIDYVAICDPETLAPLDTITGPAVALIAARVGTTRLIDNLMLVESPAPSGTPTT